MLFGVYLVAALFIALAISFGPYIYQRQAYRRQEMSYDVSSLSDLYKQCVVVVSERRGEGESQNTDIVFETAHDNQEIAVNTVLDLI